MYISIDMGATNTRLAFSKSLHENYTIDEYVKFKTSSNLSSQKEIINQNINKITKNNIKAICFSAPGTIDYDKNIFLKLPNYKVLQNLPTNYFFKDTLYEDTRFFAVNDANSAGYAESIKGVGKNYNKVLYLTIGTGIGGVLIKNKSIDDVFKNFEPGHEVIFNDGLDFEDHCSGSSFNRIYNQTFSKENIINYSKDLNKGLIYLQKKYNPEVIILGGGFAVNNYSTFSNLISNNLNVKLCDFKDGSGIIGGFEILKHKLNII